MPIATACANIALVKYWGKRDAALNVPAAGSLSLTLDALRTHTRVELLPGASADTFEIDGRPGREREVARVSRFLDLVRQMARRSDRAAVSSANAFPTAAGLASSASAFAALAVAAAEAFGLSLDARALSVLARRGSGSAARSIHGGFSRMDAGTSPDGEDAFAVALPGVELELSAAIAIANVGAKKIGSTEGMERTRQTSPYHDAWIATVNRDLPLAEDLLLREDLEALAELVEGNCLAMHANAMAARPGIFYFQAPTLFAMHEVRAMRAEGTPVFFTVDAGPHVVAFTPPAYLKQVAQRLGGHPDVREVLTSSAGEGAHLVEVMP